MELGWGIPPARASVASTDFMQHYKAINLSALIHMLQEPLTQPTPGQVPAEIQQAFYERVHAEVFNGRKDPRRALDEATPVIQGMLDAFLRATSEALPASAASCDAPVELCRVLGSSHRQASLLSL